MSENVNKFVREGKYLKLEITHDSNWLLHLSPAAKSRGRWEPFTMELEYSLGAGSRGEPLFWPIPEFSREWVAEVDMLQSWLSGLADCHWYVEHKGIPKEDEDEYTSDTIRTVCKKLRNYLKKSDHRWETTGPLREFFDMIMNLRMDIFFSDVDEGQPELPRSVDGDEIYAMDLKLELMPSKGGKWFQMFDEHGVLESWRTDLSGPIYEHIKNGGSDLTDVRFDDPLESDPVDEDAEEDEDAPKRWQWSGRGWYNHAACDVILYATIYKDEEQFNKYCPAAKKEVQDGTQQ